jgi:hypothetical protein
MSAAVTLAQGNTEAKATKGEKTFFMLFSKRYPNWVLFFVKLYSS